MKNFEYNNHTVIVTGGGTGIGYVIASSFLKSGANVVVVGRRNNILDTSVKNLKSEIPNAEGRIIALSYDLSKDTCVDKMFNEALKQFKKIDILINSCGTWKIKPIIENKKRAKFFIDLSFFMKG